MWIGCDENGAGVGIVLLVGPDESAVVTAVVVVGSDAIDMSERTGRSKALRAHGEC